ncbi:MAG: cold shock domain-containing protein [Candidatus Omnitrophica bacterium]|nr:cold shock domain-containing protein [Candidatus Omnitrophota bacterium]
MLKGRVKEYNPDRRYGIIVETSTGAEFVVYANYVNIKKGDDLKVGQNVEFDPQDNRSETWAVNVRVLDNESTREAE